MYLKTLCHILTVSVIVVTVVVTVVWISVYSQTNGTAAIAALLVSRLAVGHNIS